MRTVFFYLLFASCVGGTFAGGLPTFGFPREGSPFVRVTKYTLQAGDTVTSVARSSGVTVETVLSYNQIKSPRALRAGQALEIPNRDGLLIQLDTPTPLATLAVNYQVFPSIILLANHLPEDTRAIHGEVFVPGARLDPVELRKLLGEFFFWPTKGGRITSYFGRRNDPFTGIKTSHSGVDIANYYGAPVLAAGDGVVTYTGFNSILGNYIRVDQGQGFAAVYGHLSAIMTKPGKRVRAGQQIGKVGSSGYSTGPHLHFSAYRWNKLLNPMMLFG